MKISLNPFCSSIFIFLFSFVCQCICRDFYIGMFKRQDFLVAQDRLYKERVPYQVTVAKYGRTFKCPITYIRIADRLGMGRGPRVEIIRGGLQKNFVVLRLTSLYNLPISVNVYVGCQNKHPTSVKFRKAKSTTAASKNEDTTATGTGTGDENSTGDGVTKDGGKDTTGEGTTAVGADTTAAAE